ncbi:MAG: CoA transferase [Rhodobacteraceae bacterium]|nr:CoA transferase [Paracoccaceae bacterium]
MTQPENTSALKGIKVIDASRVLGGPYAGQILADHGADVIKVEPPAGDETRLWGPPFQDDAASYFLGLNRNKRGIAIDFSKTAGRELLLSLLEDADIFLENFKIGTLEKWGIGQDEIAERFPKLIHCRVSGFGADGPYGKLPGYDAALQATTGIMSVNGDVGGRELRVGLPVVDMVTGLNATIGVLLALNERARSGKGQFVEATLYDCGFSLLHPHLPNFYLNGKVPGRSGNAHPNISPYDTYQTATRPLFLAVGNNRQFTKLCDMLDCPDLPKDPLFESNAQRVINRDALKELLEQALSNFECAGIADKLINNGVPCGAVRNVQEVVEDPHTIHREMVVDVDGHRGTGSPIKLSRTPVSYRRRPPQFAEHTDEIMQELGKDAEDFSEVLPQKK